MAIIINRRDGDEMKRFKHAIEKMQDGLYTICELSEQMVEEYGDRYSPRGGGMYSRGDYSPRDMYSREQREDWEERRSRDSRGRYM